MTGDAIRRHRFALGLIVLVAAVLFLPALVTREVFTLRDHTDYFQPLRYFTAIHLRAFVLPHWNPYSGSGEPWLSNPQVGAFYPPTWLFIVLPFETAYMLYLALHLILLGCGAYLLFARFADRGAAAAGAIALMLSGPVLSLLDVQNNLATFAWVPWIIWAAQARIRPQWAAIFLALAFLGGEPFFAAIGAILYVVIVRSPGYVAVAGTGALGLSAVQLLPFIHWIRDSDRAAGLSAQEIFANAMSAGDWLRIAVPASVRTGAFDPNLSQHFIPVVYVGMVVSVLAVAGIAQRDGWRSRAGWVLLLAASIVLSTSIVPYDRLPLTLFRYPSRIVPFGVLAIVALAVMGWNRFRPRDRWADLALIGLLIADLAPRTRPLLETAPWEVGGRSYPAAIGRQAKILRVPHSPILDREAWMSGYVNLYHRRFDAGTAAPVISRRYAALHDEAIRTGKAEILDAMAVGFLLSERPLPLRTVARSRAVAAYVREPLPPMVSVSAGSVASLAMDTRHIRAVVHAGENARVVVSQQNARGWIARVDGIATPLDEKSGIFLAVRVPRGQHEVIFEYAAPSLRGGLSTTIITSLLLLASIFVKRSQRKIFST